MGRAAQGHRGRRKKSPTYISWDSMIARCHRPSHPRYEDYGGRGIAVCDQWRGIGGFANFLSHVGERPEGMTLDRINPDGNYVPGNVRWATKIVQRWNRRDMLHRSPPWQENELADDVEPETPPASESEPQEDWPF